MLELERLQQRIGHETSISQNGPRI